MIENISIESNNQKANNTSLDSNSNYLLEKAIELDQKGFIDDAIATYMEIIKKYPLDSQAHFNLGVDLALKGDVEQAIRAFHRAVWLNNDYIRDLVEIFDIDHELRELVIGNTNPSSDRSIPYKNFNFRKEK